MEKVVVVWEPVQLPGQPVRTWLARLEEPIKSRNFASVALCAEGWFLFLYPWGSSQKTLARAYGSPEKAKLHLEKWVSHHWRVVERHQ